MPPGPRPELWIASLDDRALRERLRRRMHLVRLRASALNRIFGLLTQWGLRCSVDRLRAPDGMELLASRGVDGVARSVAEALAVIDLLDERIAPITGAAAVRAADPRVVLLRRSPDRCAARPDDRDRDRRSRPLRAPRASWSAMPDWRRASSQSGDRSRTGALSKAGSRTLRWAAVEAAQQAWRPANPWHQLYLELANRHGRNPAKSAVARKVLIAAWHVLSRTSPSSPAAPARHHACPGKLLDVSGRLTALQGIEKPRQLPRTLCAPAPKEK